MCRFCNTGKQIAEHTTEYLSYSAENVIDGDTDSMSSGFCSSVVCLNLVSIIIRYNVITLLYHG